MNPFETVTVSSVHQSMVHHYRVRVTTPGGAASTQMLQVKDSSEMLAWVRMERMRYPIGTLFAWAHVGTGQPTVPAGSVRINCKMVWTCQQAAQYNAGYFDRRSGLTTADFPQDSVANFTSMGYLDREAEEAAWNDRDNDE